MKLLSVSLALALALAGCAGSSPTSNRRTLCGAASAGCALVAAYCSQPAPEEAPAP